MFNPLIQYTSMCTVVQQVENCYESECITKLIKTIHNTEFTAL
jgi:hypothetical protein